MVLTLAVGAGIGWVAHRAKVQREAVAAIEAAGGSVRYDFQRSSGGPPSAPGKRSWFAWLVDHVGVDYVASPVAIRVDHEPHGFDDAVMAQVGRLERLEELDFISPFSPVTDAGMAHLAGLTRLKSLHLASPAITDDGLAHLAGLVDLETLLISELPITSVGLRHLAGLRKLNRLALHGTRVRDLGPIAHLNGLRSLAIGMSPVDDVGLAPLVRHPGLTFLDLSRTRITDAALADVATIPLLGGLVLDGTAITGAGLGRLAWHPWLAVLWLGGTKLSDSDLIRLASLPNAKSIHVDNTGVTAIGALVARAGHPSLAIEPPPTDLPPLSAVRNWCWRIRWRFRARSAPGGPVLIRAPAPTVRLAPVR